MDWTSLFGVTGHRLAHYITWHCSLLASSEYPFADWTGR
jgi:hypothetical protein